MSTVTENQKKRQKTDLMFYAKDVLELGQGEQHRWITKL